MNLYMSLEVWADDVRRCTINDVSIGASQSYGKTVFIILPITFV